MLVVEGLEKRFGALRALDGFSLTAERGQLTGLIGPNGAGKSTAFGCIAGAIRPSAGSVSFEGRPIEGMAYHRVAQLGLARTYQVVQTFADMTVLEAVTVGALMRRPSLRAARAYAMDVVEFAGLGAKRDMRGKSLTIADKKRLEVARALSTEPALLLLDEVMAGLTPAEAQDAVELLRAILARGTTIVMVEHVMEVLMPLADHIVVLSAGRTIFSGTAREATANPAVLEAYLGPPL
ncbi:MAG: ABC transporter ATP-binding protein [Vulcanimicrobiaceae bacterium]|jgi:branched-chain amino acid transport system ATP-binding protein